MNRDQVTLQLGEQIRHLATREIDETLIKREKWYIRFIIIMQNDRTLSEVVFYSTEIAERFRKLITKCKDRARNQLIKNLKSKFLPIPNIVEGMLEHKNYIRLSSYAQILNYANNLHRHTELINFASELSREIRELQLYLDFFEHVPSSNANFKSYIKTYNKTYINKTKIACKELFNGIEDNPLTENQIEAVLTDEDNVKVVAGAGSGKSSVVIAKIIFLIKYLKVNPSEIKILAFNRAVIDELMERCFAAFKKFDLPYNMTDVENIIRTFHAFGKKRIPPSFKVLDSSKPYKDIINNALTDLFKEPEIKNKFLNIFVYNLAHYKSTFEFDSQADYDETMREYNKYLSASGYKLKSFEEVEIANYLYSNGIEFDYEHPCEFDINGKSYLPDFYLTEYDIYIEHFGVNRQLKTAFKDSKKYVRHMKEKIKLHKKHGTKLITTYSYYKSENCLIEKLEEQLKSFGVEMCPEQAFEKAFINEGALYHYFKIQTLMKENIDQFKANNLSIKSLRQEAARAKYPYRLNAYLDVFERIIDTYNEELSKRGIIDFSDMIGEASKRLLSSKEKLSLKYLICDEFQDTSLGRLDLIKAIKHKSPPDFSLYVVGDDWQSINRFAGSDIDIFTKFEQKFNDANQYGVSVVELNRTFRFDGVVNKIASSFIEKNPSQLKKSIQPNVPGNRKSFTIIFHDDGLKNEYKQIETIIERIISHTDKSRKLEVLVLDRYSLKYKEDEKREIKRLKQKFKGLVNITRVSIHQSKGLGEEYVIVKGLKSGTMGFPTQIENDPIKELFLPYKEGYQLAEERRLFYVAITRVKKQIFLLASKSYPSMFVTEVINDHRDSIIIENEPVTCPECYCGILTTKKHPKSKRKHIWHSCTRRKNCGARFPACVNHEKEHYLRRTTNGTVVCSDPDCKTKNIACPDCNEGILLKRESQTGFFWGCSTYSSESTKKCRTYSENDYLRLLERTEKP